MKHSCKRLETDTRGRGQVWRRRTRLVAKGYSQRYGIETVVHFSSIRALAVQKVHPMESSMRWIRKLVYKLKKSLYGLKQVLEPRWISMRVYPTHNDRSCLPFRCHWSPVGNERAPVRAVQNEGRVWLKLMTTPADCNVKLWLTMLLYAVWTEAHKTENIPLSEENNESVL